VARNAFGLALLAAMALSGCSQLDNLPFVGNKKAKEAEVRTAALRARTDSLRKARRAADSLSQVRFAACVDSVRAELVKPAVAVKKVKAKSKSRKAPPKPSEELIAAQAQSTCGSDAHAPMTIAGTDSSARKAAAKDSMSKTTEAAANAPAATDSAKAVPAIAVKDTARIPAMVPAMDSAAVADSIRKARETEMTRETFAYSGSTRDPFNSLLNMEKAGPEVADLQLVGIYQNMRSPSASVAVFREKEGGKRHKLRAGDQLGRSRVVQIRERDVVFMIEDFGFERQETLSLRKQEDVTP
jgi:PBP1b-binding outer membrane lipoprotein LpoB